MIARFRTPPPPLDAFVDKFWYYDGYIADCQRERALPTGTVELVVNLRDDPVRVFSSDTDFTGQAFGSAVLCGAHSGYFVLSPSQQNHVIGIHFRPGGAPPLLGMPASETTDRHIALEDIWGVPAARLRERLLDCPSADLMFDLLESSLLERFAAPLLINPAVEWALRELTIKPAMLRIGHVRQESGYSSKRFIALFRNATGLTPKIYSRIQRFQAVLRGLNLGRRIDWAGVAADGGYTDQSHLNREFRAFAGVTPGEYRPVAPDRPNHVAIL